MSKYRTQAETMRLLISRQEAWDRGESWTEPPHPAEEENEEDDEEEEEDDEEEEEDDEGEEEVHVHPPGPPSKGEVWLGVALVVGYAALLIGGFIVAPWMNRRIL